MPKDLRVALRGLLRAPGFTAAAVLALGLGTGAATAVFSLLDGVVLRPLPYPDPERLVVLREARPGQVLRQVVGEGLALALPGVALGTAAAAAAGRALAGLLHEVRPADPATLGAVAALVLAVAALACAAPGRRAALTDPVRSLRAE